MPAQRFRKKPVEIEAMQWDGTAAGATPIIDWALSSGGTIRCHSHPRSYLSVDTLEGAMSASKGDWIICGVENEFYPCKPSVFAATYEAVP